MHYLGRQVALFDTERLLPYELVERLLQTSPADLRREPFGPLLLLVRVPAKPPDEFAAALEQFTLNRKGPASPTGAGFATTELPTVHREPDDALEPDQVGLLAELESSVHCAVPLHSGSSPLCVGRARANSIVLRDDSVSQTHAEIAVHDEGVSLLDRQSKNGTWVNGTRLAAGVPRWLQAMDRLQFGRVQAFTCTAPVLRSVLRHRLRRLL